MPDWLDPFRDLNEDNMFKKRGLKELYSFKKRSYNLFQLFFANGVADEESGKRIFCDWILGVRVSAFDFGQFK